MSYPDVKVQKGIKRVPSIAQKLQRSWRFCFCFCFCFCFYFCFCFCFFDDDVVLNHSCNHLYNVAFSKVEVALLATKEGVETVD